jgi:hypothetical protein
MVSLLSNLKVEEENGWHKGLSIAPLIYIHVVTKKIRIVSFDFCCKHESGYKGLWNNE